MKGNFMSAGDQTTLKVEFELSETDIAFFKERLDKAREARGNDDDAMIIEGVAAMTKEALAAKPPQFVVDRLTLLDPLLAMLRDDDWKLTGDDRKRVLDALAYFVDPEDLIPDRIPGIGYIDDAIMIDLVSAGLEPELEAYADFVAHREELASGRDKDAAPLEEARKVMQGRMRRRRSRARGGRGGLGNQRSVLQYF
jgi:uncharacterized membrane protein YkvA (DUF1232 family)